MTDTAKIVALPGVTLDSDAKTEVIIEACEMLLQEAKAGRIAALGAAWVSPQNVIETVISYDGRPFVHTLLAATIHLQDRVKGK